MQDELLFTTAMITFTQHQLMLLNTTYLHFRFPGQEMPWMQKDKQVLNLIELHKAKVSMPAHVLAAMMYGLSKHPFHCECM